MTNPYWGKNIFEFFLLFFQRMKAFFLGKISWCDMASDEIQVLVLSLIAISSALIGTFLVLKKMTMLANSLSHTILLGIVIAYLILIPFLPSGEVHAHGITLQILLIASLATALVTTMLTQLLTHVLKLQEDASTGLVFTTLFALGIVLVTMYTRNTHLGTEAIMGNVDALHFNDLKLIFWVALLDIAALLLFYKGFKITSFDPAFADAQGISSTAFNYFLMVLTSATVIGAFRAVGVLLVLSFIVGPTLTARLFTHRLKTLLFLSMGIGVCASLFSVALSRHLLSTYHLAFSTAGLTTSVLGATYFLSLLFRSATRRVLQVQK